MMWLCGSLIFLITIYKSVDGTTTPTFQPSSEPTMEPTIATLIPTTSPTRNWIHIYVYDATYNNNISLLNISNTFSNKPIVQNINEAFTHINTLMTSETHFEIFIFSEIIENETNEVILEFNSMTIVIDCYDPYTSSKNTCKINNNVNGYLFNLQSTYHNFYLTISSFLYIYIYIFAGLLYFI